MWQAWSEDKQAVFHAGFVGQQIDLKKYSKTLLATHEGNEAVEDCE